MSPVLLGDTEVTLGGARREDPPSDPQRGAVYGVIVTGRGGQEGQLSKEPLESRVLSWRWTGTITVPLTTARLPPPLPLPAAPAQELGRVSSRFFRSSHFTGSPEFPPATDQGGPEAVGFPPKGDLEWTPWGATCPGDFIRRWGWDHRDLHGQSSGRGWLFANLPASWDPVGTIPLGVSVAPGLGWGGYPGPLPQSGMQQQPGNLSWE